MSDTTDGDEVITQGLHREDPAEQEESTTDENQPDQAEVDKGKSNALNL